MPSPTPAAPGRTGPAAPADYPADAYRAAGVDRDLAERVKDGLAAVARRASDRRVVGGIGGFGGAFRLEGYRRPVLVSSTDGVGTKVMLGAWTGRYEPLGRDLVNACLNDVAVTGADPLFFLDYVAAGAVDPAAVEALVRGMADECAAAGCALIGGETAEMPGVYGEGGFDMAGFAVGAAEEGALCDPARVRVGDALVGLPSSGMHTNGFSLVRRAFGLDSDPSALEAHVPELGRSLGEELSEPHRSYVHAAAAIRDRVSVMAHITGGGLVENVPRVLPDAVGARFFEESWEAPPIFALIAAAGGVSAGEMRRVFNMGLGLVAACDPERAGDVASSVPGARIVGETVAAGPGAAATDRVWFE